MLINKVIKMFYFALQLTLIVSFCKLKYTNRLQIYYFFTNYTNKLLTKARFIFILQTLLYKKITGFYLHMSQKNSTFAPDLHYKHEKSTYLMYYLRACVHERVRAETLCWRRHIHVAQV